MKQQNLPKWLYQISIVYLALPFIIFCLGWLNIFAGLLFAALAVWASYQVMRTVSIDDFSKWDMQPKIILAAILILGLWVLLSGIGGYTFQNWDHHWRNAVFRDLIRLDWPVIYPTQTAAKLETTVPMLTYYIGFWLPAAVVGKLFGWEVANLVLFFWAWLGVVLVGLLLQQRFKKNTFGPILLLIFFSGMDIVGMLLRQRISPLDYFEFWPPSHRLENWTTLLQYSSNTTQLFWIFNQAIPSWLFITLWLTNRNQHQRYIFFLWSLCVFYAPLQAVGILPFIVLEIFRNQETATLKSKGRRRNLNYFVSGVLNFFSKENIKNSVTPYISPENIGGGGSILTLIYLYFSQSILGPSGEATSFNIILFSIFLILEGGLLWLLIYPQRRDHRWVLIGIVLFICLFLHNDTFDFGEKISASALFLLMITLGDFIFKSRKMMLRSIVLAVVLIGSITSLYEISRSMIKTTAYYLSTPQPLNRWDNEITNTYPIHATETVTMPEVLFHPNSLVADGIKTISSPEEARWISNYIGEANNTFFYNYLARKR